MQDRKAGRREEAEGWRELKEEGGGEGEVHDPHSEKCSSLINTALLKKNTVQRLTGAAAAHLCWLLLPWIQRCFHTDGGITLVDPLVESWTPLSALSDHDTSFPSFSL